MIRLIVNADDLGLHPEIDRGIFEAKQQGILTSATLLATGRNAALAVEQARAAGLSVGLHLALCQGLSPAAEPHRVTSVAPGGRFRRSWSEVAVALLGRQLRLSEVALELRAQLQRARALGAQIDHLDAHQHLHLLPGISQVVQCLAAEESLPLRWPSEAPRRAWLSHPGPALKAGLLTLLGKLPLSAASGVRRVPALGVFEAGRLGEPDLLALIDGLGPGTWELGCHPGFAPDRVEEDPAWRYGWEDERRALCSEPVREAIRGRGIVLSTYGSLG